METLQEIERLFHLSPEISVVLVCLLVVIIVGLFLLFIRNDRPPSDRLEH